MTRRERNETLAWLGLVLVSAVACVQLTAAFAVAMSHGLAVAR